jgi:site-specific DNA-methyltransferase (adenine-specific)
LDTRRRNEAWLRNGRGRGERGLRRRVPSVRRPVGKDVVLDPFAGCGSTLAACEAIGYKSVGVERDRKYFDLALEAMPKLSKLAMKPD